MYDEFRATEWGEPNAVWLRETFGGDSLSDLLSPRVSDSARLRELSGRLARRRRELVAVRDRLVPDAEAKIRRTELQSVYQSVVEHAESADADELKLGRRARALEERLATLEHRETRYSNVESELEETSDRLSVVVLASAARDAPGSRTSGEFLLDDDARATFAHDVESRLTAFGLDHEPLSEQLSRRLPVRHFLEPDSFLASGTVDGVAALADAVVTPRRFGSWDDFWIQESTLPEEF